MRPWIEKYIVAVIATGITRLGDVEHAYGPETLQIMVQYKGSPAEACDCLWALCSDSRVKMPVCFTRSAVKSSIRSPRLGAVFPKNLSNEKIRDTCIANETLDPKAVTGRTMARFGCMREYREHPDAKLGEDQLRFTSGSNPGDEAKFELLVLFAKYMPQLTEPSEGDEIRAIRDRTRSIVTVTKFRLALLHPPCKATLSRAPELVLVVEGAETFGPSLKYVINENDVVPPFEVAGHVEGWVINLLTQQGGQETRCCGQIVSPPSSDDELPSSVGAGHAVIVRRTPPEVSFSMDGDTVVIENSSCSPS